MYDQRKKTIDSLAPLLRKLGWESDVLKAEVSRLNALVEREERQVWQIVVAVREAEQELRVIQGGAFIRAERKESADVYLKQQHALLRQGRTELAKVQALRDQAAQRLADKKKEIKALEKHREKKEAESRVAGVRQELREADWVWLTRPERRRAR